MTEFVHDLPRIASRRLTATRWVPLGIVVAGSVACLVAIAALGDYSVDAGPPLAALSAGHVGRALQLQPLMGSLSLLIRAPFALVARLAGADETGVYRAGVLPCLVAPAVLAVALARRHGSVTAPATLLVALLAVLTPASIAAVQFGHPEEALGAALVVGAVLFAERGALWAGVLLGLALATKQWAVVAVPPVIWLVPCGKRVRSLAIAAAVAAVLTLPLLAGSAGAFERTSHNAATAPTATSRATVWYLIADHKTGLAGTTVAELPSWVAQLSHPLIVVVAPLLLLLVWRRRPTLADALALLALALLLRCVLDPVNNEYYHLPFVLALLAYETVSRRGLRSLPLVTLFSCAGLSITFLLDDRAVSPALTNAAYLAWTAAVGTYLVVALRWSPR